VVFLYVSREKNIKTTSVWQVSVQWSSEDKNVMWVLYWWSTIFQIGYPEKLQISVGTG
jgi:hypothetical protein